MLNLRRGAAVVSAAALLALTPAALASGGGVNSGGVNSGGGGGGAPAPTPTPAPTSCATISSFSNSDGYYAIWAAIWTKFSIANSCPGPVTWQMTYTNGITGAVDFARASSTAYMSSGVIDEDWAAFSTPYTVALTVTDPSTGAVIASQSAVVTTKSGKTPGA
jgi:hypothetical protein